MFLLPITKWRKRLVGKELSSHCGALCTISEARGSVNIPVLVTWVVLGKLPNLSELTSSSVKTEITAKVSYCFHAA